MQAVRLRLGSAPELDGTLNIQAMHFLFLLPDGCAGSITPYVKIAPCSEGLVAVAAVAVVLQHMPTNTVPLLGRCHQPCTGFDFPDRDGCVRNVEAQHHTNVAGRGTAQSSSEGHMHTTMHCDLIVEEVSGCPGNQCIGLELGDLLLELLYLGFQTSAFFRSCTSSCCSPTMLSW